MTEAHRATLAIKGAKLAIAGLTAVGAVLAAAGQAAADPVVPDPAPAPADPALAAPPPPAPAGPPQVPEIANPVYGSGQYGGGPVGTLRDLWHQAHDPGGFQGGGGAPEGVAPPPGAGPAPPLPPGYVSINAPGSETPGHRAGSGQRSRGPGAATWVLLAQRPTAAGIRVQLAGAATCCAAGARCTTGGAYAVAGRPSTWPSACSRRGWRKL